jgi:hypothetical protein
MRALCVKYFNTLGKAMKNIALFICLIFITSCASTIGEDFPIENAQKIVKGVTTKNQILTLFGEPRTKELKTNNIEVWSYSYLIHTKEIVGPGTQHSKGY